MKENFAATNKVYQPKIKVIGLGYSGFKVAEYMKEQLNNIECFTFEAGNSVWTSSLDEKHKIVFSGEANLSESESIKSGQKYSLENKDKIKEIVKNTDLVFVVSDIGSGEDVETTAIVTQIAKEQGAVNIVFAVTPADFEGKKRNETAKKALQMFQEEKNIDGIIIVSKQRFINIFEKKATFQELCDFVSSETAKAIKSIIDIFQDGLIQINFDNFKGFISNAGYIGIGISEKTKDIKSEIKTMADYPMIQGSFEHAEKIIISIKIGNDVILSQINEIIQTIQEVYNVKGDAEILFGVQTVKEFKTDEVRVTVITA